jgi:dihydroneopterin aldolase
MDIIFLNEIRIETIIGMHEWERRARQVVILDVEMGADIPRAAASDQLKDTLDYQTAARRIMEFVSGTEFRLLETLAESVADLLLREFKTTWCRVRLKKQGAVKGVRDVGVMIERARN